MNAAAYLESIRDTAQPTQPVTDSGQRDFVPGDQIEIQDDLTDTDVTLFGLVELILKDRDRLEAVIRRRDWQATLIPRLTAISLASFVLFGVAMAIVMSASGLVIQLTAMTDWLSHSQPLMVFTPLESLPDAWRLSGGPPLVLAYAFGLIAATGVCLPSLYFYGLLAGVKLSVVDVVAHALKAKATTAVALVGILPVYVAISMGVILFDVIPDSWLPGTLLLGLCLPFIAGLWGTVSLYRGFARLADTLPAECRDRRACFLRRLVASWGACYTAVAPVMIFTIWQSLQQLLG